MSERQLAQDRLRGALLGLAVGELLASPAEGRSADDIMRTYGRLVHIRADSAPGPITALATRVAVALSAGRPFGDIDAPPDLAIAFIPIAVAARLDLGKTVPAGEILDALANLALGRDPFDQWPARACVERVGALAGDAMLDRLRHQSRSAVAPIDAATLFADVAAPTRVVLEVAASLLARPHSSESAIVYATSLGGPATLRAALTACIAGIHRGAAALPSRCCDRVSEELTRAASVAAGRSG